MNLTEKIDEINSFKKELKDFQKSEVYEKLVKDWEWSKEALKYSFEYLDEAIKTISNLTMCLYHANIFINEANKEWK